MHALSSSHSTILKLGQRLRKFFLLLKQDRHYDCLKRPRTRDHDASLDMELGTVKQPIEQEPVPFWQCMSKRRPPAAFCCNEVAQWRQCFAHDIIPDCDYVE
jgi:hypothetical protein